ncbi:hypothetical protein J7438_10175 [Thalassotalea sp. G20_0]|nr:hypothetical protein [Thalassotalea sp. G20_0]
MIQEKITITHETLLTMLAGISRPDLIVLHCENFGIAPEQVRFLRENQALEMDDNGLFSVWPDCVKAINTDAALNHELDFFKLCKFVIEDRYLSYTKTATLAFAAGYPELMELQDLQQLSKATLSQSNVLLFKKILDKKGGSMKARELVEIMSNPEIMAISSAHKLINALQGQPAQLDAAEETSLIRQTGHLGHELASIGINAESFGHALELPLHIIQKISNRVNKNNKGYQKISKLLSAAKGCLPQLTPGHIAYASMVAARSCNCDSELLDLFQKKGKDYAFFRNFNGKKPPQVKPLNGQDNNISTEATVSKPLTMDFLRCLPLSHNWLLIGRTMGLSQAELKGIGSKITADGWLELDELSLAAYELSRILVQPERGLETGHLFQALKYLDDQAALAYFPGHLSGDPDNPLPGHIAKSLETGRLMTRLLQTCNTEEITGFLELFQKYDQMQ